MRRAVYAGSFDPLTNGHMWMITEGIKLFDKLTVAIGVNPDKTYTFPLDERLELLRECTKHLENVTVDTFENDYLAKYATKQDANFILRGIRSETDYAYERGMRHINGDMRPGITTVFLIPPREFTEISSSFIKGLIGPEGWQELVQGYVPAPIYEALIKIKRP